MQKLRLLRTLFIMMHEEAADMLFGTANGIMDGAAGRSLGKHGRYLLFYCSNAVTFSTRSRRLTNTHAYEQKLPNTRCTCLYNRKRML